MWILFCHSYMNITATVVLTITVNVTSKAIPCDKFLRVLNVGPGHTYSTGFLDFVFPIKPTSLSLWCCEVQYKSHDNTSSSPWLYRRLLYDFIAILVSLWAYLWSAFPTSVHKFAITKKHLVLVSDQWQSANYTTPFITHQHLTSSQALPFPATKSQETKGVAWQAKEFLSQAKELHRNNAIHGETIAFLFEFFFMCGWSDFIGLWDVGGLGHSQHGLRTVRQRRVQWILQSQNRPFQRHGDQNLLP